MVVWQHSRWMFAKADCAKNLQIENQACLSTLVTTLLSDITFHLLPIWLQTLVAIVSESCLTLFPSFCTTIWSCCAVQFKSEQTPFPQTSCRFRPAALHHILLRDQRLIERLSELRKHWAIPWLARTCCIPSKFSREKSDLLQPEIYKALKPFWLLNWVRLARVVAYFIFSSREPVASCCCHRLWNTLCLCLPVLPVQAEPESCPKSLAVDFALWTFDYLLEQILERLPDVRQGLKLKLGLTNEL